MNSFMKKWINAELILHEGKNRKINVKIKLHGDWNDHISIPYSSLDIKSKDVFMNQLKEFILFRPSTRRYRAEIFGTILMQELGLLAPTTKEVEVIINSHEKELYLLQEKINKFFLERAELKEGPIIEFDERPRWNSIMFDFELEKVKSTAIYRLDNSSFIKNKSTLINSLNAISQTENKKKLTTFENKLFETVMSLLDGCHGLIDHNRKFYYESIYENFIPIYYDGMFFNKNNINFCVDQRTLNDNNFFLKDIKSYIENKINNTKFKKKVKNKYINSTIGDSAKEFDKYWLFFVSRFEKYKNLTNEKLSKNFVKLDSQDNNIQKKKITLNNKFQNFKPEFPYIYFYSLDNNRFVNCIKWPNNKEILFLTSSDGQKFYRNDADNNCNKINLEKVFQFMKNDIFFIPDKYNNLKIYPISLGNVSSKSQMIYPITNFKYDFLQLNDLQKINNVELKNNTVLFVVGKNRKKIESINFYSKNKPGNSPVIFISESINVNEISYSENKTLNLNNSRIEDIGITGCLNFYDSNILVENIEVIGSSCEDGINLVRSKGYIKNIFITRATSDGIDFDYSNIKIDKIKVDQSLGDCIDFSFGKYLISLIEVNECKDKGVSIGEISKVKIQDAKLKNSDIGIAIKDSSVLEIYEISENLNNNLCVSLYNKKKEFRGGKIIINKMPKNCGENIYIDNSSEILVK